jgi:hypothetical protein
MTAQSSMVAYSLCTHPGDCYAYTYAHADALLGPPQLVYPVASPAVAPCSTPQNCATAGPVIHVPRPSPTRKIGSPPSASQNWKRSPYQTDDLRLRLKLLPACSLGSVRADPLPRCLQRTALTHLGDPK